MASKAEVTSNKLVYDGSSFEIVPGPPKAADQAPDRTNAVDMKTRQFFGTSEGVETRGWFCRSSCSSIGMKINLGLGKTEEIRLKR